jgi:hypothetical protein|tara:strand:+ start:255 stop:500 length:246 start_codon:yes stop_codon:yes gene_type:complete
VFNWLTVANLLLKAVNGVLARLERKELMDAGELKAIQTNNEVALKQVQVANEIRNQNKRLSESDVTDELSKYTRGSDSNDQ